MQFQGFGGVPGGAPASFPPQPPGMGGPGALQAMGQSQPQLPPASTPSPLLRIRAGIEAGNHAEVMAGVQEADKNGVVLAPNVRDMITQWLSVNGPKQAPEPEPTTQKPPAAPPPPAEADTSGTVSSEDKVAPPLDSREDAPKPPEPAAPGVSSEKLRAALLRFFSLAPKGSDAASGLGIMEGHDGNRYLPLPMLGKAVGLQGQDFEVAMTAWNVVNDAPPGTFLLTEDARAVGLVEWSGWEEFSSSLDVIVKGTRDPAFEPRSIQGHVARCARGAVRSGPLRQADVLKRLQELSSDNLPEDAAPALRSAIHRRARLALACLVDAIASQGLGPQAGVDSMGLVGQLPRTLFGTIFDNIDDRDRGACAFLGEILQSWDRRRCFSKRWLQDAAGKFSMPKGANTERDGGRGWYALTSENLGKTTMTANASNEDAPIPPEGSEAGAGSTQADTKADTSRSEIRRDSAASSQRSRSPPTPKTAEEAPKMAEEAKDGTGDKDEEAHDAAEAAKKKRKIVQHDDDDDETVAKRLEESRRRRAALMAKYQDGKKD
eukprot:CAMPEP_0197700622 /NCGR_PEP_ID=MMETSP1338-20131121/122196_1 /TAXON_ID=43686 ORGANISM="Pelagodinium beii, Strain RCC1491" /NCGR_SAMPLE_ID=MMETSP1338 /ASSEMBLY_ACC=CAM_ASM_000754 /LENGTH=547 /DNA_ID=CAMNT_0043284257 /DNA_START=1 /DNA_END=1644 /DNA_ORIENTATION=+